MTKTLTVKPDKLFKLSSSNLLVKGPIPFQNLYSVAFDGIDDYVDLSSFDPSTEIGTSNFTVSMWVYSNSSANQIFWYMGDASKSNMMRINYLASSGGFKIWAASGGVFTDQYPHVEITNVIDTWYHILISRSGTTVTLYVNGTNSDSKTHSSLGTGFGSLHELGRYVSSNFLNGNIDEYAIWNTALTSQEAVAIYNSGSPFNLKKDNGNYTSSSDLIGYWRFEEGTGDTAADSVGANTADLENGATFSTNTP